MQSKGNSNIRGIDISNWQTEIDYNKVKQSKDVVIIKATEGVNFKDRLLETHYNGCKSAGLKVGFYHFFSDKTDPALQARDFWEAIKSKKFEILPVLDVESSIRSRTDVTNRCLKFLNEMKKLSGYECIVYTYTNFAQTKLDNRLSKYPLWIAHYGVSAPGYNGIWDNWVGFQYTEKERVPGVLNPCDANKFTNEIFINKKEENKKVEYLVVYNNISDQRAAEYLADKLNCPTIYGKERKFDYTCVKNVIGVGGSKEQYTSYLKTLISGNSRYDTMQAVLDYIKK